MHTIMLDQNAGRHGVVVPFFGRPASTARSLAVLALKSGAPVVPAFIHRLRGDYRWQLTLKGSDLGRVRPLAPRGRGWSYDIDP